jgi:hypothetical protein
MIRRLLAFLRRLLHRSESWPFSGRRHLPPIEDDRDWLAEVPPELRAAWDEAQRRTREARR